MHLQAFHKRFAKHRLNLANGRKEFFRISLSEVIAYAKELNLDAEFSSQAEARDFYISNQIRSTLTDDEISKRLDALTAKEAHDNSESDEDDIEYQ